MGVENIKRWQWCIIGLVVGGMIAAIRQFAGYEEPAGTENVSPFVFENQLVRRIDISQKSVLKVENLRIHPAIPIPIPGQRAMEAEILSYDAWLITHKKDTGAPEANKHHFQMVVPLALNEPHGRSLLGKLDNMPMREYLAKLHDAIDKLDKTKPQFKDAINFEYREAILENPKVAYTVFPVAGLLIIGVVWPSIMHLLIGAGLGRAPADRSEEYLDRFKGGAEPSTKSKSIVTDEEHDKLKALEAQLEASLRAGAGARKSTGAIAVEEAPVKVLNAGPAEPVPPPVNTAPSKPKGYGADQGDYYPTEVHGKKP